MILPPRRSGRLVPIALIVAFLVLTVGTAALYLAPLDQMTTDLVSNVSFGIGGVLMLLAMGRAIRLTTDRSRWGWLSIAVSFGVGLAIFASAPASSAGEPTAALLMAPVVAVAVLGTVLAFNRHTAGYLGLTRMVLDGLWLTMGLTVAAWHWFLTPIPGIVTSTTEFMVIASFPLIAAITGTITLLLLPHSARGRWSLAALGGGAAILSLAGAYHVRHAAAGDLQFGTWYDFLWTLGISLLGVAALDHSMGSNSSAVDGSLARSHQVVTIAPVVLAVVPFLNGTWEAIPPLLWLFMLVVLASRSVLLISQSDDLTQTLETQATRDELTGLLNRRALLDLLAKHRRTPEQHQPTVLYLDLDGFKGINDLHGHAAGDHVLLTVAHRLLATVRETDAVARLGGDEFVVLVRSGDANETAGRLREAVIQPIDWEPWSVKVGCSIGVADDPTISPAELLSAADGALYRAKDLGGNQVVDSAEVAAQPTYGRRSGRHDRRRHRAKVSA